MFALENKEVKKTLDNLIYNGERHPQMYWTKFEQQLNTAFATYVKVKGRVVHSDTMKLTSLMSKVKCDSLSVVTAALTVAIQGNPNYNYASALKVYKAEVGKSGTTQNRNWQVREQNQDRGRGGHGFGRGFRRGRDRGGGYNNSNGRGYSSGRGRDGRGRVYSGRDREPYPEKTELKG